MAKDRRYGGRTSNRRRYTAKRGDTFVSLAQSFYGTASPDAVSILANANKDIDKLAPGIVLTVPTYIPQGTGGGGGGTTPQPAPTTTTPPPRSRRGDRRDRGRRGPSAPPPYVPPAPPAPPPPRGGRRGNRRDRGNYYPPGYVPPSPPAPSVPRGNRRDRGNYYSYSDYSNRFNDMQARAAQQPYGGRRRPYVYESGRTYVSGSEQAYAGVGGVAPPRTIPAWAQGIDTTPPDWSGYDTYNGQPGRPQYTTGSEQAQAGAGGVPAVPVPTAAQAGIDVGQAAAETIAGYGISEELANPDFPRHLAARNIRDLQNGVAPIIIDNWLVENGLFTAQELEDMGYVQGGVYGSWYYVGDEAWPDVAANVGGGNSTGAPGGRGYGYGGGGGYSYPSYSSTGRQYYANNFGVISWRI